MLFSYPTQTDSRYNKYVKIGDIDTNYCNYVESTLHTIIVNRYKSEYSESNNTSQMYENGDIQLLIYNLPSKINQILYIVANPSYYNIPTNRKSIYSPSVSIDISNTTKKIIKQGEFIFNHKGDLYSYIPTNSLKNDFKTIITNENNKLKLKYNTSFSFISEVKVSFEIVHVNPQYNYTSIETLIQKVKEHFGQYSYSYSYSYSYFGEDYVDQATIYTRTSEEVLNNFVNYDTNNTSSYPRPYLKSNMDLDLVPYYTNPNYTEIDSNQIDMNCFTSCLSNIINTIITNNSLNVEISSSGNIGQFGVAVFKAYATSDSNYEVDFKIKKIYINFFTPRCLAFYVKKNSSQPSGYEIHQFNPYGETYESPVSCVSNTNLSSLGIDEIYINNQLVSDNQTHYIIINPSGTERIYLLTDRYTFNE